MSFYDWLAEREPAPPPALAARLRAAVNATPAVGPETSDIRAELTAGKPSVPETLRDIALDAGVATLAALVRLPEATRAEAIDLLAADALVTYAFEAAAESPESLDPLARAAMERIARLAGDQQ